jgi:hypothetical protein
MSTTWDLRRNSASTGIEEHLKFGTKNTWTGDSGFFGKIQSISNGTVFTNIVFQDGSTLDTLTLDKLETIEGYVQSIDITAGEALVWRTI